MTPNDRSLPDSYAVIHTGMGVSLGVFLVSLWRSLGRAPAR